MHLSGEVPGRIAAALGEPRMQHVLCPEGVEAIDGWAVHAGGRSILDAVGHGLGLSEHALDESRTVLDAYGNMSRSEEHTSELQSLMRISYAVFCLTKKKATTPRHTQHYSTST